MSRQVDDRVVSMQFDNKNFESNARTTMSTLDKLKEKLNFKAATKGVDNLEHAVKKVDLSPIGQSADKVGLRFSAMYTIADQTFRNIINSAEATAKRMLSAFTVAPVKDGFSEYEMTLNAVQTTMSATGKTAKEVEKELKKLDEYADKTVYSTADMLNNLPKFTNAGVELEAATKAMIGIANATALAGGDASKASIAFYNLGQAIGTGYLTRMDYNSINNAGIATMEWKNQMVDAAIAAGTLTKAGEDLYTAGGKQFTLQQLFIDGLQEQWATTEVMTKVFSDYGDETTEIGKKSYSAAQDIKTFSMMMDSLKATAGTGWKDTWQQIFGGLDDAKKFWTDISNFLSNIITSVDDARNFLLQNALNFASPWEALQEKLDASGVGKMINKIEDYTDKLQYFQDIMHSVWMGNYKNSDTGRYDLLDAAGYDHRVVQELVNISDTHYKSQGWKYQLTVDDIRAAHEKYGVTLDENALSIKKTGEETESLADAITKLSDEQLKQLGFTEDEIKILRELQKESKRTGKSVEEIAKEMSEFQGREALIDSLKNAGKGLVSTFTAIKDAWVEIFPPISFVQLYNAIRGIHEFSKKLVMSDETADKLKRTFKGLFAILDIVTTLVGGGFKIAFKAVKALLGLFNIDILEFTAMIGDGAVAVRDWMDSILDFEKIFEGLANFFVSSWKAIKTWIAGLKETDNVPRYLYDTIVKGLMNIASSAGKQAANVVKNIVSKFDQITGLNISGIFSKIYSAIEKVLSSLKGLFAKSKDGITEWYKGLKETDNIPRYLYDTLVKGLANVGANMVSKLKGVLCNIKGSVSEWFTGLKEAESIPHYILSGLINGIQNGAKAAWGAIVNLGNTLISKICEVLGIQSPSTVFFAIGSFIIAGLVGGLLAGETDLTDKMKELGNKCIEAFKSVDWGSLLAIVSIVGFLIAINKIASALDNLANPFEEVGRVLNAFAKTTKSVSNVLNAYAIKTIAISIAIIAASILALALIPDMGKAWQAVGMIATIMVLLMGVMFLIGKVADSGTNVEKLVKKKMIASIALLIASIGAMLLLVAGAAAIMSKIDANGFKNMSGVIALFLAVLLGLGGLTKVTSDKELDSLGKTLISIAITIGLLAVVAKMMSGMNQQSLLVGLEAVGALVLVIWALVGITKIATNKELDALGGTLRSMALTIGILAIVTKMMSKMNKEQLAAGLEGVGALVLVIWALVGITKIATNKELDALGKTLRSMAVSIAILAIVAALLGKVDKTQFSDGCTAIAMLELLILGLVIITNFVTDKEMNSLAKTLMSMAVAIGILTMLVVLIGLIKDPKILIQGLVVVGVLALFIKGLIEATKDAKDAKEIVPTLIVLTAAIAILGGLLIALSCMKLEGVIIGTLAMAGLMEMMILLIKSSKYAEGSMKTLVMLALVVGLLGTVLIILSKTPWQNSLAAAGAMAVLMLTMTGVLKTLSKMDTDLKGALKGAAGLVLIALSMMALFPAMKLLGTLSWGEIGKGLVTMAGGLAIFIAAAALINSLSLGSALTDLAFSVMLFGVGCLAAGVGIAVLGAGLSALAEMSVTAAINIIATLGIIISGIIGLIPVLMGALTVIVTSLCQVFIDSIPAIAAVIKTLILTIVDLIVTCVPAIGNAMIVLVLTLINVLVICAPAIANGLFTILLVVLDLLVTYLPPIVDKLVTLIISLLGILTTRAPEFVAALVTFMAAIITSIAENITPLIEAFATIFVAIFQGIAAILGPIIEALAPIFEVFTNLITGAMSIISTALVSLAEIIANTVSTIVTVIAPYIPEITAMIETIVTTITDAIVTIVETLAPYIPEITAMIETIVTTITNAVARIIEAIAPYIPSITSMIETIVNAIVAIVEQISPVIDSITELIRTTGDTISEILGTIGEVVKDFGESVKTSLDGVSGVFDSAFGGLADVINSVGDLIKGFLEGIADIIRAVGEAALNCGTGFEKLANGIETITNLGLVDMIASLTGVADGLEDIQNRGSDIDDVGEGMEVLAEAVSEVCSSLRIGLGDAIKSIIDNVAKLPRELSSKAKSMDWAVRKLIMSVETPILDMDIVTPFTTAVNECVSAVKSAKANFESAGSSLVDGLAAGILVNKSVATAAAQAVANAVESIIRAAWKVNSPSKVFYKIALGVGEGMENAFGDSASMVKNSATKLANYATTGIGKVINKLSDAIHLDIDAQPTITPVLDLSNVTSGANAISGLFSGRRTLTVDTGAVGVIASSMAQRQNGPDTGDVVSSIKALRKDLANMPRESITIDGITYDDGSNIAEAVKTIVRATRIEGRA